MTERATDPQARREKQHELELLRQMLLIRRFEERSSDLYQMGKIRGFLHLYIGEEAVAVGAMQALTAEDAIVSTYREHGHALARGMDASVLMAELYGKVTGCSKGHGGSMHFFDAEKRFYGGYAIVGGGLPIAVGLALADKMLGRKRVTACFFGDGAVVEGEFHESMNLAKLWSLPVLFLCENNRYAMGTALDVSHSVVDLAAKAEAYDMPSSAIDGMDVLAVEAATREAADRVRQGRGPVLLELRTYRFRGHSLADPELYRSKEEVQRWQERDPIPALIGRLRDRELLSDSALEAMEQGIKQEVDAAVQFAEESPWEPLEDLTKDVLTP
jgi:pyruvate dehydrogenase E1 component alpha subunit/2-oxoisovalerate dehydrogenase E1 component